MLNNKILKSNTSSSQTSNSSGTSAKTGTTPTTISSSSGISTAGLEKGQLIRGEVTDLRPDEVSIKTEDGKVLTGKLEGSTNLAIGDKVVFRIEDVSLKSLTLKIIANTDFTNQDNTIEKALEEAGLTKTDRNYAIVNELLKQQMSIDKNTISLLIRQSLQFKDSSISSLVLMNKLNLPVTENNVKQFQAYTSFESGIMDDLKSLADSLTGLFEGDNSLSDTVYTKQNTALFQLLYGTDSSAFKSENTTLDSFPQLTGQNPSTSGNKDYPLQNNSQALLNAFSSTDFSSLADALKAEPVLKSLFTEEALANIKNGSANTDTLNALNYLLSQAGNNFSTDMEHTFINSTAFASSDASKTLLSFAKEALSNGGIGSYLNASDRLQLLSSLESLLQSSKNGEALKTLEALKPQIISGLLPSTEVLKLLQSGLEEASPSLAKAVLTSDAIKTLLKEQLLSNWSLTPQDMGKGIESGKHMESLLHQLSALNDYIDQSNNLAGTSISEHIGNIKENIQFMNNLNQLFTFIQIPLKMTNQYTDSQLYVYSRKKSGKSRDDGVRVLLHLNMEHLGALDVYVELKNNNLTGKFYLEDTDTVNLFSSHIGILESVLNSNGYSFHSQILLREKKVNIIQDFIDQEAESAGLTRYNFDLRA